MRFKFLSIISLLFLTSCASSNVGFPTNFSAILLQDSLINSSKEEIDLNIFNTEISLKPNQVAKISICQMNPYNKEAIIFEICENENNYDYSLHEIEWKYSQSFIDIYMNFYEKTNEEIDTIFFKFAFEKELNDYQNCFPLIFGTNNNFTYFNNENVYIESFQK